MPRVGIINEEDRDVESRERTLGEILIAALGLRPKAAPPLAANDPSSTSSKHQQNLVPNSHRA